MSDRDKKLLGVLGVLGVLAIGVFVVRGMGNGDNPTPITASPSPTQPVAAPVDSGGSDAPAESSGRRSRRSARDMGAGDDEDRLADEPVAADEGQGESEERTTRRPKRPSRRPRASRGEDGEEDQEEEKKEVKRAAPMGASEL